MRQQQTRAVGLRLLTAPQQHRQLLRVVRVCLLFSSSWEHLLSGFFGVKICTVQQNQSKEMKSGKVLYHAVSLYR